MAKNLPRIYRMSQGRRVRIALLCGAALVLGFPPAGAVAAPTTRLVARSPAWLKSISENGRFVVFDSSRSDLVPGDTNGVEDVFVRDVATGTTERASVSSEGAQANDYSWALDMSADGRYVLFKSFATNLRPNDTNQYEDAFIRDRLMGTTRPVQAVVGAGTLALSGNGRYIAWASPGHGNIIGRYDRKTHRMIKTWGGDETSIYDVSYNGRAVLFLGDRWLVWHPRSGRKIRFDQALGGRWASRPVYGVALSGDGHRVMFDSRADNLVQGDTNGRRDVFVRNLLTNRTVRVNLTNSGTQTTQTSWGLGLSENGRYRLFGSLAANLVRRDTNEAPDLFVRDRETRTTIRCSLSSAGEQANKGTRRGFLSADGRFVAFMSRATNLVPFPTAPGANIFIRGPRCLA